jgi:hypothetical protein
MTNVVADWNAPAKISADLIDLSDVLRTCIDAVRAFLRVDGGVSARYSRFWPRKGEEGRSLLTQGIPSLLEAARFFADYFA